MRKRVVGGNELPDAGSRAARYRPAKAASTARMPAPLPTQQFEASGSETQRSPSALVSTIRIDAPSLFAQCIRRPLVWRDQVVRNAGTPERIPHPPVAQQPDASRLGRDRRCVWPPRRALGDCRRRRRSAHRPPRSPMVFPELRAGSASAMPNERRPEAPESDTEPRQTRSRHRPGGGFRARRIGTIKPSARR